MTLLPWAQMSAEMNTDLNQRIVQTPEQALWYESPANDIHRRPLDRTGAEVAKATSIVRYLPGSQFASHQHGGGEEILVLEGTFSDEHGDYPVGTYLRNPPGTSHAPFSKEGCLLLVKLWQFSEGDTEQLCIRPEQQHWQPGLVPGLQVLPLHQFDGINTALVRWAPNTRFQPHVHAGGEEIYVLEGLFQDEFGSYPKGSWLRSPRWSKHQPFTGSEGALIYVKVGHLGAELLGDQLSSQNL
ncbi:cupin domain-containing protein [Rheinheimera tangshanensis]|jgi:anti-sigma factor ChrR (cupin superfamily)|nr:cupin [Rheinheimera tangshanensis]